VGMVSQNLDIPNYMYRVVYRELIITGLYGRHMYKTWELLERLLDSKKIDLKSYVGLELPLKDIDAAVSQFDQVIGRIVLVP
jgi:threonine 3-dehydrogenase